MAASEDLRAEIERLRRDYENLREELRNLRAGAGATLRRGVLAQAGSTAEAICKFVYRREGMEAGGKPTDRMMLDELIAAFGSRSVPPEKIRTHLRTVQSWRNSGVHDKGDIFEIDDETIEVVEKSLGLVVRWFFTEYMQGDFGQLSVAPVGPQSTDRKAVEEWRELLWWVSRNGAPRALDEKGLAALQARLLLSDEAVGEVRNAMKRSLEGFVQTLHEAAEDGTIERYEADALEQARVDACISRREAKELAARELSSARLEDDASAPSWMREVIGTPDGVLARGEQALRRATEALPLDRLKPALSQVVDSISATGAETPVAQLVVTAARELAAALPPALSEPPAPTPGFVVPRLALTSIPQLSWPVEDTLEELTEKLRDTLQPSAYRFEIFEEDEVDEGEVKSWTCQARFRPRTSRLWDSRTVFAVVGDPAEYNRPQSWVDMSSIGTDWVEAPSPLTRALRARVRTAGPPVQGLVIDGGWGRVPTAVSTDSRDLFLRDALERFPLWCKVVRTLAEEEFEKLPQWAQRVESEDELTLRQLRKYATPEALADPWFAATYAVAMVDDQVEEAFALARRLLESDAPRRSVQSFIAHMEWAVGDARAAWETCRAIATEDADPTEVDLWVAIAEDAGAHEEAVRLGLALLKRSPWRVETAMCVAKSLVAQRRLADAELLLREVLSVGFRGHEHLHLLAEVLVARGAWDDAMTVLQRDVKKSGDLYDRSTRRIEAVAAAKVAGRTVLDRSSLPAEEGAGRKGPARKAGR